MKESEFEGSRLLEVLVERGMLDEFWEAVDSDDFSEAAKLMQAAGIGPDVIQMVLQKMEDPADNH